MRKVLNGLMAVGVIAVLLAAMVISILLPKTENPYENRPAVKLPAFSLSSALSGAYQDALESALHDQLPASQVLEQLYQNGANRLILRALFAQSAENPNAYYQFNDLLLFRSDIVYAPVFARDKLGELSAKAEYMNRLFVTYPELSYYVFYIEKDTDFDFENGVPTGVSDEMLSRLWLPESHMAVERISSFADFRERFYRTDHHWNHVGSYAGYTHLLRLLGKTDPLKPVGTVRVGTAFRGAKALVSGAASFFSEPFDVYRFDFPRMDITINGFPSADYGRQSEAWDEEAFGPVAYGSYYGFDYGEVTFHTDQPGAGNILVLGESFDNAILKLLASHFENLYAVDLRAYKEDMGKPFRFSEYIAAHNIDTVLLIGNIDYFLLPSFNVGG